MWDCHLQLWESFGNSRCPGAQASGPFNPMGREATGCLRAGRCLPADKVAIERQSTEMGFSSCHLLNYPVCYLEDALPFGAVLQHGEAVLCAFMFIGFPLGGVYATRLHLICLKQGPDARRGCAAGAQRESVKITNIRTTLASAFIIRTMALD